MAFLFRTQVLCCLSLVALGNMATAQMVTTQSPFVRNGTRFYESSQVGWSVQNPNYFIRFNGGAPPPFGGYQPNTGLRGGFAAGNSRLGFEFGQGSSLTSTSITPVLTSTNGYPAGMFIGSTRPFVTGVAPVVAGGSGPMAPVGPLVSRLQTGQLHWDEGRLTPVAADEGVPPAPAPDRAVEATPPPTRPSPAAAKADWSVAELVTRAEAAERSGRIGVARVYYQLAATRSDAIQRLEIQEKLDRLPRTESIGGHK